MRNVIRRTMFLVSGGLLFSDSFRMDRNPQALYSYTVWSVLPIMFGFAYFRMWLAATFTFVAFSLWTALFHFFVEAVDTT